MSVRVELRHGGLEAVAFAENGPTDPTDATRIVLDELKRLGVIAIPNEAEVRTAILAGDPKAGIPVARGTSPQPGIGAQLVFSVPSTDTPLSEGESALAIHWRNVVYPGDLILRKTPASEGIPGRTLLGSTISASAGADVTVVAGSGVRSDPANLEFRAAAYGVALIHNGRVRVAEAVSVSNDRMEARLTVLPDPRIDERTLTEKIVGALATLGARQGLRHDAILAAVRAAQSDGCPAREIVAAQGKHPIDGTETDYRLVVDLEKKACKVLEGERADFREMETVKNVHKGEVLAEIVPARQPVPGFRLDGTVLQPKSLRAQGLKPGDHTITSEDGARVLADVDGMIVLKGGKFHVVDEYVIPEDVDFSTGNIRAAGSVRVRGQIKPGFLVQAGKEVDIGGDVWEAQVESLGDVHIRGSITAGSRVKGKNVSARFVLNSRVEAEGDMEVSLSVTGSEVYVRGKLTVLGSQGVILGGEVNAAKGIEARTIGSSGSRTKVAVGQDLRVAREWEELQKARSALGDELKSLAGSLGREFLKDPRGALLALPPALRKPKIEILQRMKDLQEKEAKAAARHDELAKLALEERGAQIVVHGEILAGTCVTIGPARTTLTEDIRHAVLQYDAEHNCVTWRRL